MQDTENALSASTFTDPILGYQAYMDVDSFIDWYLVNEILKNSDAANYSSIFFHKSSGEKLKMGPIWDFDTAIGNNDYTDAQYAEGWWIRAESPWFNRLFQDPAFAEKVKNRWNLLHSKSADLPSLLIYIDKMSHRLQHSQEKNFSIWNTLSIYAWPNRVVTGSYESEVSEMKSWLSIRMNWMDRQFNP